MSDNNQDNVHGDDIRLTSRVMGELSSYGEDEQRRDQGNDPNSDHWESTVRNLTSSLKQGFQTTSDHSKYSMDAKRRARLMKRLARPAGKSSPYQKCVNWIRSRCVVFIGYFATNRSEFLGAVCGVAALLIFGVLLAGPFSIFFQSGAHAGIDDTIDSETSSLSLFSVNGLFEEALGEKSEDKSQAPSDGVMTAQYGIGPASSLSSSSNREAARTQNLSFSNELTTNGDITDDSRRSLRRSKSNSEIQELTRSSEMRKESMTRGLESRTRSASDQQVSTSTSPVPERSSNQPAQFFGVVPQNIPQTAPALEDWEETAPESALIAMSGSIVRSYSRSASPPSPAPAPPATQEPAAAERGRARLYSSLNKLDNVSLEEKNAMDLASRLAGGTPGTSRRLAESQSESDSAPRGTTSTLETNLADREKWAFRKSKGLDVNQNEGFGISEFGEDTSGNSADYAFSQPEEQVQEFFYDDFGRQNVRFGDSSAADSDSDGIWLGQEFQSELGTENYDVALQDEFSTTGGARFDNGQSNGRQWFSGGRGGAGGGGYGGGYGGYDGGLPQVVAGTVRERFIAQGIDQDKDSKDSLSHFTPSLPGNSMANDVLALQEMEALETAGAIGSLFAKRNLKVVASEPETSTFAGEGESKVDNYYFERSDRTLNLTDKQPAELNAELTTESLAQLGDQLVDDGFVARKAAVKQLAELEEKLKKAEPEVRSQPVIEPRFESEPFPEVETVVNAVSTFSLNVNDASFQLARSALDLGQLPDKSQIRSEEFINALNYYDPKPSADDAVAIHYDRAIHPFEAERQVLRIGVQTAAEGLDNTQPMNLVVVLDTSGSMERPDRSEIAGNVLQTIATELESSDKISVVGFARRATLWADGIPGGNPGNFMDVVQGIRPDGGTNIEQALNLAYEKALEHFIPGGRNRVLLLTDGAANLGEVNPARLRELAEARRKQGIALDAFGIGWEGHDDDLLESLTRNSDGNYGFLSDPFEAAEYFRSRWFGAVEVAAKDVKVQVEFNPARVLRYRQVGYLKHRLTQEQFWDNTVDAAEIARAEDGQAVYIIEVDESGNGPLGWVRVRYKQPATDQVEMKTRVLAAGLPAPEMEISTPAMKLAFTSAALAEKLAGNPYAAEVSLPYLEERVMEVSNVFSNDPVVPALISMVRNARIQGL